MAAQLPVQWSVLIGQWSFVSSQRPVNRRPIFFCLLPVFRWVSGKSREMELRGWSLVAYTNRLVGAIQERVCFIRMRPRPKNPTESQVLTSCCRPP